MLLFIYPMWDNESERIGKQKCTPFGYALHCIADLLGLLGLLLLAGFAAYIAWDIIVAGKFRAALLWLLAIPIGLGLLGQALFLYSWRLADKRGFQYNAETREASWIEDGQRRTYKWEPNRPQGFY
jgi:hypothetical protein